MRLDKATIPAASELALDGQAEAIRQPAKLISIRPSLAGLSSRQCEIRAISAHQAVITVFTTMGLSSHYYLEIDVIGRRIGCAEVYRDPGRVVVKFLSPLSWWELTTLKETFRGAKHPVRRAALPLQ